MKALIVLCALSALFLFALAQTPSKPVWPNYFSATIIVRDSRRPFPEFFRWFYDSSLNKDRMDGVVRWQDEEWFAENIFDHATKTEYNIYFQEGTVVCYYHALNRTLPKPNFANVNYLGKGLVDYVPAYHWFEDDRQREVSFQVYDAQTSRRNILRIDVDHRREHRSESFNFLEFDLIRQDPNMFKIPAEIMSICNPGPAPHH